MNQGESDTIQTLLAGEGHLLELIFTGVPLTHVLDKICSALDHQVGNVASLVLLADDDEYYLHAVAQSAAHFGFYSFRSTGIFSPNGDLLGTFEMYCCVPRTPSSSESRLIERATRLAALAIQRSDYQQDSETFSWHSKGRMGSASRVGPPSRN